MRVRSWLIAMFAGALIVTSKLSSQEAGKSKTTQEKAAAMPACCLVVGVDSATSIVTARETSSGYTFKFKVSNKRLLNSLKLGDKVWANFTSKKVRLRRSEEDPCCTILTSN